MRKMLLCLLVVSGFCFAGTRAENIKCILEKSYLETQAEPFLDMMAMQAIAQSEKKIESDELVAKFRTEFVKKENLAKLFKPYDDLFSDKEIAEWRTIIESPVSQKFSASGMALAQSHMQTIREIFEDLAQNFEAEIREAVTSILEITNENKDQLATSAKPIILDVSADWCGPCNMLAPIFEDLSEKYKDQIQFAKIDFDAEKELASELKVVSLPTILFIKPGEKTASMKSVGFLDKKSFEEKIDEFLQTVQ